MKANIIALGTMAVIFSAGVALADGCGADAGCADGKTVEAFRAETRDLSATLHEKSQQLAREMSEDRIDTQRTSALEREIGQLRAQLKLLAKERNISSCSAV
jgi:hypothetical protein